MASPVWLTAGAGSGGANGSSPGWPAIVASQNVVAVDSDMSIIIPAAHLPANDNPVRWILLVIGAINPETDNTQTLGGVRCLLHDLHHRPLSRARIWQCVARLAMGTIAMYNALLGLTEPTSLTARALGPDNLVDMVQLVQIICASWILAQAGNEQLRQSRFSSVPFGFVMLSLLVQFWFVVIVGLSSLVAAYYLCLTGVFALGALSAATNVWKLHRIAK